MSIFASPKFLRRVLLADALSCAATGGLQLLAGAALSSWTNLPSPLLAGTGWFLVLYAGAVAWLASRKEVPQVFVWIIAAGNLAWAAGCAALWLGHWAAPSALGTAWLAAQAVTVVVLAELQIACVRRAHPPGWA